jgi:hypothetical protein
MFIGDPYDATVIRVAQLQRWVVIYLFICLFLAIYSFFLLDMFIGDPYDATVIRVAQLQRWVVTFVSLELLVCPRGFRGIGSFPFRVAETYSVKVSTCTWSAVTEEDR